MHTASDQESSQARSTLIATATEMGATVIRAPGATVIVIADPARTDDDLLPLAQCASIAKCSVRTLSDARRSGELTMFGSQRARTVRRADLERWIESRRSKPLAGADDDDIERRMRRLAAGSGS